MFLRHFHGSFVAVSAEVLCFRSSVECLSDRATEAWNCLQPQRDERYEKVGAAGDQSGSI